MNDTLTVYDKTDAYENTIMPEIEKIKLLCVQNDIPFFMTFATMNTEDETVYKMDGLMPGVQNIKLQDNKFGSIYNIISDYSRPDDIDYSVMEDDFPEEIE